MTFFFQTAEGSMETAVQDIRNLAGSFLFPEFAHQMIFVYFIESLFLFDRCPIGRKCVLAKDTVGN